MKKILFFGALVAMLLGTAACSSDMEPSMGDDMVRFTIELPGNIDSRAISDGTTANKLTVAVYDDQGNELSDIRVNKDIPHQTTVEFKLVKGQKYSFAFWAQAQGAPYTFDTANKTVNVSYTDAKSNDEKRDAFYAYRADLTVTGPMSETIYLYRPFCQLNYGASDYQDAIKAGVNATKSAVTVKNAATTFNLATGESTGSAEVTFTQEVLPNDPATLTVEDKTYQWMAMNYFLVPNNEATIETSLQLYEDGNANAVRDITVPNVPVQKNHRTNIVGNLFTEDVNFLVIIDEHFDQPDYNVDINGRPYLAAGTIQVGVNGEQYTTLAEAIAAANGETVYLGAGTYDEAITVAAGETVSIASAGDLTAADVTISQQIKTEAGATLDLNGIKVTSDVHGGASIEAIGAGTKVTLNKVETVGRRGVNAGDGAEVVINNSYINAPIDDNEGQYYNRAINIYGEGTKVSVENSTVKCESHYAFNYPGSADGTELVIKNCDVIGWGVINIWGKNNTISAEDCKFTSINVNSGLTNAFQAITIAQDAAINNSISVKNSSFYIEAKGDQFQRFLKIAGTGNAFTFENVHVTGVRTLTPYLVGATSAATGNYTLEFDDNCVIDWSVE